MAYREGLDQNGFGALGGKAPRLEGGLQLHTQCAHRIVRRFARVGMLCLHGGHQPPLPVMSSLTPSARPTSPSLPSSELNDLWRGTYLMGTEPVKHEGVDLHN